MSDMRAKTPSFLGLQSRNQLGLQPSKNVQLKCLALGGVAFLLAACGEDQRDKVAAECKSQRDPGMVWVEGGTFILGEHAHYPEEGPPHEVEVEGFWIDRHEVTNADFAEFVTETGYLTVAERDPPAIAGAPPEMLQPGSAMFEAPSGDQKNWWRWQVGAQWRHPAGPGSDIDGMDDLPVVHIAYEDALAYAEWAGKSLPTEAQWEYAARAGGSGPVPGLDGPRDASRKPTANFYQGVFPVRDLGEDGFTTLAPVGCFPANDLGLHDMIGNVWEWTSANAGSVQVGEERRVIKGGSYLCASNYCARYRPAARQFQEMSLGTNHIGFRLVDNARPEPNP